jgi:hypothetical protein
MWVQSSKMPFKSREMQPSDSDHVAVGARSYGPIP